MKDSCLKSDVTQNNKNNSQTKQKKNQSVRQHEMTKPYFFNLTHITQARGEFLFFTYFTAYSLAERP